MTDYSELVKALRHCTDNEPSNGDCWNCPYQGEKCHTLLSDAAAAIEDMAKHITEMHERVTVLQIDRGHLETEVKEWRRLNNENLLPKRGKWLNVTDSYSWYGKCSVCGEEFVVDAYYAGGMNYCPNCGAKTEVQDANK